MARIRSIKPELRTSVVVAGWPVEVRYFFVLLWGYLDDRGRGLDAPKQIAGDCFPYDEKITAAKVDAWLTLMGAGHDGEQGPVCRYEHGGKRYLHCVNWSEHQRPNRPTPSRIPPCPLHDGKPPERLSEPLTESLNGTSVPGAGEQGSRGSRSRGAEDRSLRSRAPAPADAEPPDGNPGPAEQLITTWMNGCNRRPPSRVVDDVGRLVAEMLRDGIESADIERGLHLWQSRGSNPKTLPSFVNQVMNARPSNVVAISANRPSTTDQRVGAALALAEKFREDPA